MREFIMHWWQWVWKSSFLSTTPTYLLKISRKKSIQQVLICGRHVISLLILIGKCQVLSKCILWTLKWLTLPINYGEIGTTANWSWSWPVGTQTSRSQSCLIVCWGSCWCRLHSKSTKYVPQSISKKPQSRTYFQHSKQSSLLTSKCFIITILTSW